MKPPTPYLRPPITREVDPNRINWVWKLIAAIDQLKPAEVSAASEAAGIPLPKSRVKAWSYAEDNPDFSALNVDELERTLRALIAWRRAQRTTTED